MKPAIDRRAALGLAALALLAIVVSLAQTPYRAEGFNHSYQLPVYWSALDPGLYEGDRAVEASLRHPSLYWKVLAPGLGRLVGLETALWFLYLLGRAFYVSGVVALGFAMERRIGPVTILSAVLAGIVLAPGLGSGGLVRDYAEQTSFANGLLLGAIAAAVASRWRASIGLGLAGALFNLLYAVHAAAFVAPLLFLAVARKQLRGRELAIVAACAAAAAALVVAVLRPGLTSGGEVDAPLWIQLIRANAFYHVDLFAGDNLRSLGILLAWAGACLCAWGVGRLRRNSKERIEEAPGEDAAPVLACLVAWPLMFLALVGSSVAGLRMGSPMLVGLQGLRAADLLAPCLQVAAIAALARLAPGGGRALGVVIGSLLFLCFWLPLPTPLRLIAPFAGVAIALFWKEEPLGRHLGERAAWLAAALLVVVGGLRVQAAGGAGQALFSRDALTSNDWVAVSRWARDNTPRDARFLLRPYGTGARPFGPFLFRARSQRGALVTWMDHTLLFFDPPYATGFHTHMRQLGVDLATPEGMEVLRRIPRLADDYALALGERHELTHWIIDARQETSLPVLARTEELKVVLLQQTEAVDKAGSENESGQDKTNE